MSDLRAGLLLLQNMKHQSAQPKETPVTSTRSRNRPDRGAVRPPLVGRLHEMATASHVVMPTEQVWWQRPLLGGPLIPNPQMTVLGRPGRGKAAVVKRWLYANATRRTRGPVVVRDPRESYEVLDELAGCEPLDLSASAGRVIDPLVFDHARSSSPRVTAGEW